MKRIFIPTTGPDDWRKLLSDPGRHWKQGYSAMSLALRWEEFHGFPPEVEGLFLKSGVDRFRQMELIMAFPEYQVHLPGGSRPSQNDLFALAKDVEGGLVTLAIEGKASEPFGPSLQEWRGNSSRGREERLHFILETLGLPDAPCAIRYQLLHRMASAVLEAQRFRARSAAMIVHSFSEKDQWFEDFRAFLALFGKNGEIGRLCLLKDVEDMSFFAGWAKGAQQ